MKPMLDLSKKVKATNARIMNPIEGDLTLFTFTYAGRHPSWSQGQEDNNLINRNLELCAYAGAGNAKARLGIEAVYE